MKQFDFGDAAANIFFPLFSSINTKTLLFVIIFNLHIYIFIVTEATVYAHMEMLDTFASKHSAFALQSHVDNACQL